VTASIRLAGSISPPVPLTAEHDRSGFACRHPVMADWLRNRALANQVGGASRTYVVERDGKVIGYYSLAPGSVDHAAAPSSVRRNQPAPIPAILLGRLAVHLPESGKGIGQGLLKDAIRRALEAREIIGGRVLLCHAIDEDARDWYLKRGFHQSPIQQLTVMLGLY